MSSLSDDCSICLSALIPSDTYVITKCGHFFHKNCIRTWFTTAYNCPNCRTTAYENDVIKVFVPESANTNSNTIIENRPVSQSIILRTILDFIDPENSDLHADISVLEQLLKLIFHGFFFVLQAFVEVLIEKYFPSD